MTPQAIIDTLAERDLLEIASKHALAHQVTLVEMLGDSHERACSWARQALWNELFSLGHWSQSRIGRVFNRSRWAIAKGISAHLARTGKAA